MDYLLATLKTALWVVIVAILAVAITLFEAYGIPFIVDNFKIIIQIVASVFSILLILFVFRMNLLDVRKKKTKKLSDVTFP